MKYSLVLSTLETAALSIFSGILLLLAFPNTDIPFFAFIALIPYFIIIFSVSYKKIIFSNFIFILIFYGFFLNWVMGFNQYALPGILLVLFIYYTITAFLSKWLSDRFIKIRYIFPPLCFCLLEFVRTIGFLKFPYGNLAYSQYKFIPFIQFADITGWLGISFVIYLINSLLSDFAIKKFNKFYDLKNDYSTLKNYLFNRFSFILLLFLLILGYGFYSLKFYSHSNLDKKHVSIAMIQPWHDFNKPTYINSRNSDLLYQKLERLTLLSALSAPDLIVWHESALYHYYEMYLSQKHSEAIKYHKLFQRIQARTPSYILSGTLGLTLKQPGISPKNLFSGYNSAIFIGPDSKVIANYNKIYLVPFAEWFPFEAENFQIPLIKPMAHIFLSLIKEQIFKARGDDFSPGTRYTIFRHPKFSFNVLICYEDCFADICRKFINSGSELLIVITNDAWSYTIKSEVIHFAFSVLRSIENRRSIIRGTNAGVTAYIDALGRTVSRLSCFKEDFLVSDVVITNKKTIYTKYGDMLIYPFIAAVVFFILFSFFKKREAINIKFKKAKKID